MITNVRRGLMAAALAFAVLAPASPAQADEVTLIDGITALPVADEIRDGYKRELYPHWKDDDKNGCTARNDVLIAEAIDHMVPLAEVHDSGGYGWTTERRRRYANDLGSDVTLVG
ncbi:HNH endonuclease, partial [Streptomyces sp. BF23-30]